MNIQKSFRTLKITKYNPLFTDMEIEIIQMVGEWPLKLKPFES